MKFIDLSTWHQSYGTVFPVVNEDIEMWRRILKDISVKRAASICSGGEVSFFSILPHVEDELMLIDHNYTSMYYAIGKYKAIEKLGAEEAHKLFSDKATDCISLDVIKEGNAGLPTETHGRDRSYSYGDRRPIRTNTVWSTLSQQDVADFAANKDKISFVHGDISDMGQFGPFDLLYLSNAMDYSGRNGSPISSVEKVVKPGGFVAYCNSGHSERVKPGTEQWERVASHLKHTGSYGLRWSYWLCKLPIKEEA